MKRKMIDSLHDLMVEYYRSLNQIVWKNKKTQKIRWLGLDHEAVRVFNFLLLNEVLERFFDKVR